MSARTSIVVLGASHHATPVEVREKLSVPPEQLPELHQIVRTTPGIAEAMVLNTCNRFELYCVSHGDDAEAALEHSLCNFRRVAPETFSRHRFVLRDVAAVTHLLDVAVGVESQLVGEAEIFGQVKAAYSSATSHATVGPILNRVVQKCFQAAKYIRSNTPIGEGQISVATVTVDLTQKIFGDLSACRVLVLGTGEVGEKTVKALNSRKAKSITVLSRQLERAKALAATVNGTAGTFEQLSALLPKHDIVVGSTIVDTPIITGPTVSELMRSRKLRPLFFVDLGMPRNFDAKLANLSSVFLYDLDDLARIADENLASRHAAMERCKRLSRERAERIWQGVLPRINQHPVAPSTNGLTADGQTA